MLFQVNPPLLLWTVALLASLLVAGALVALIEPLSRRTRLQRVGWRVVHWLLMLCLLTALLGLYVAL